MQYEFGVSTLKWSLYNSITEGISFSVVTTVVPAVAEPGCMWIWRNDFVGMLLLLVSQMIHDQELATTHKCTNVAPLSISSLPNALQLASNQAQEKAYNRFPVLA